MRHAIQPRLEHGIDHGAGQAPLCFCLCSVRTESWRNVLDSIQQCVNGDVHCHPCPPSIEDVAHVAPSEMRVLSGSPCIRPPIDRLIPGQRGLPLPALAPTRVMLQKLSEAEKV